MEEAGTSTANVAEFLVAQGQTPMDFEQNVLADGASNLVLISTDTSDLKSVCYDDIHLAPESSLETNEEELLGTSVSLELSTNNTDLVLLTLCNKYRLSPVM